MRCLRSQILPPAASLTWRVMRTSSGEGVGSPPGWQWDRTTMGQADRLLEQFRLADQERGDSTSIDHHLVGNLEFGIEQQHP